MIKFEKTSEETKLNEVRTRPMLLTDSFGHMRTESIGHPML